MFSVTTHVLKVAYSVYLITTSETTLMPLASSIEVFNQKCVGIKSYPFTYFIIDGDISVLPVHV
jgi:hypothetical protein